MNYPERPRQIPRERLSETSYFSSLLVEAQRSGLLREAEVREIGLQSARLLEQSIQRYTRGESSSVTVETAKDLLQSIFYILGFQLKQYPYPEDGIAAIRELGLSSLFQNGKAGIKQEIGAAERLLDAVLETRLCTENRAYHETLETGFRRFFAEYDGEFSAHEIPADLDYPVSRDLRDTAGIEWITRYLRSLLLENQFCLQFSPLATHNLLRGYQAAYADLLLNLYEQVLANALGCCLAGGSVRSLEITPADRAHLETMLTGRSAEDLQSILQGAAARLFETLSLEDPALQLYCLETTKSISVRLENALEHNSLSAVFVTPAGKDAASPILFEAGRRMDDAAFRSLTEELRSCRFCSDKLALIQAEIHSFSDLADVLGADCLFDAEYPALFACLKEEELALLLQKTPAQQAGELDRTESEREWQEKLIRYIGELDPPKKNRVLLLSRTIRTE